MSRLERGGRRIASVIVVASLCAGVGAAGAQMGGSPWARSRLLGGGDRSWLLKAPRSKAKGKRPTRLRVRARSPEFHLEQAKGYEAQRKYRSAARAYERALRLDASSEDTKALTRRSWTQQPAATRMGP